MIVETPVVPTALDKIRESSHQFYLTGSRFFGTATEGSDWDFFVKHSEEVALDLHKWGFQLVQGPRNDNYKDKNTVVVFWHPLHRVHVQLVHDDVKKEKIQLAMRVHLKDVIFLVSSKDRAQQIWNFAFSLLESGPST